MGSIVGNIPSAGYYPSPRHYFDGVGVVFAYQDVVMTIRSG